VLLFASYFGVQRRKKRREIEMVALIKKRSVTKKAMIEKKRRKEGRKNRGGESKTEEVGRNDFSCKAETIHS